MIFPHKREGNGSNANQKSFLTNNDVLTLEAFQVILYILLRNDQSHVQRPKITVAEKQQLRIGQK